MLPPGTMRTFLPEPPGSHVGKVSLSRKKNGGAALLERFTARYVRELLARHEGNVTKAAEEAGIARQHFAVLAKRYGA